VTAVLALAIAGLFGAGVYGMLKRDLIRVVVGTAILSYAVALFVIASGLSRGYAPIHPIKDQQATSDPLVQALVLTAIVISAGTTAVMIGVVHRVYATRRSLDQQVASGDGETEGVEP
jgi:multicomponent Na+:H+ antiporter subunit C